jgi:transcriptional regulator with XRE-family HTH domain
VEDKTPTEWQLWMGELIAEYRKKAQLSPYALGKLVGCSSNLITRYESGDVSPSGERLNDIFVALERPNIPLYRH